MLRKITAIAVFVLCLASLALASGPGPGIGADEALQKLKDGNARFVAGKMTHPNADAARRAEINTKGQTPYATIIGCSDSREALEVLFDQGLGDIFVIRVAGNTAHTDVTGTAEYGTEHLNTPLLVVLGHTKCGAVTAVTKGDKVGGNIPALVAPIVPAVNTAKKDFPGMAIPELAEKAVIANVWQTIDDLFKNSPIIRDLTKNGKLKVVGGVYHLDSGEVKWLGAHPDQAKLLAYTSGPAH